MPILLFQETLSTAQVLFIKIKSVKLNFDHLLIHCINFAKKEKCRGLPSGASAFLCFPLEI